MRTRARRVAFNIVERVIYNGTPRREVYGRVQITMQALARFSLSSPLPFLPLQPRPITFVLVNPTYRAPINCQR